MDSFGLGAEDIEGDFDPDVYDQAMQRAFNEDYYEGAEEDEEKPEFSDLEEVGGEIDQFDAVEVLSAFCMEVR